MDKTSSPTTERLAWTGTAMLADLPAKPGDALCPDAGLRQIMLIGNYIPRQCGIATFTADLCEALGREFPDRKFAALPVNDTPQGYSYPDRVRFELFQDDLSTYAAAADFLNISNVDVVCLQHEYGIFGGRAGSHILALLRELRMPVVTTLHTVLK